MERRHPRQQPALFHFGDYATFLLGDLRVRGMIVESEGLIGAGGRRLYRVEVPMDPLDPYVYVVAESELEPAKKPKDDPDLLNALDKPRIIDYLKRGGLLSILMASTSNGRNL